MRCFKMFINPFCRYSALSLFVVGLFSFVVGTLLAYCFSVSFDGVLDVHVAKGMTLVRALKENMLNVVLLTLLLLTLGVAINRKTRWIDMLNVVLIFRIPLYLILLLSSIPIVRQTQKELLNSVQKQAGIYLESLHILVLLLFSILSLGLFVYSIILLFNGFKTASNAKTWQHYMLFIFIVIVAEVVSKIVF